MNNLSIHRSRPSIEILTPAAASVPVNAALPADRGHRGMDSNAVDTIFRPNQLL